MLLFLISLGQSVAGITLTDHSDSAGRKEEKKVKITAYPAAGYSPETSLSLGAVGLILFNKINIEPDLPYYRPSSISPYFLFTLNNQFLSAIDFEFYFNKNLNFKTAIRYFNYPDYYYDQENRTSPDRELFNNRFFKWDGHFSRALNNYIFIGIAYEWLNNDITNLEENGLLENRNPPGIKGGNILGVGPQFRFDTRNNILYPDKGVYFDLKTVFYPDLSFNDYNFKAILLDLRSFTTLFSEKNIFAAQFYYQQATGNSVPFYKLPKLGGDIRMRGLEHENRYIDHHAWHLQIEGRRELFWRFGGVIFAGIGDVASRFSALDVSNLKYVVGLGGRFRPFKDESLNLRLDIGKGPGDQYAVYIAVGEAF